MRLILFFLIALMLVQGASAEIANQTAINSTTHMVDILYNNLTVSETRFITGLYGVCNSYFNTTCEPELNNEWNHGLSKIVEDNIDEYERANMPVSLKIEYMPFSNITRHKSERIIFTRNSNRSDDEPTWSITSDRDRVSYNYGKSKGYYPNKLVWLNTPNQPNFLWNAGYTDVLIDDSYVNRVSWITTYYNRNDILYAQEHRFVTDIMGTKLWNDSSLDGKAIWYAIAPTPLNNSGLFRLYDREGRGLSWLIPTLGLQGWAVYGYYTWPDDNSYPVGDPNRTRSGLARDQTMRQFYANIASEMVSLNDILIMPTRTWFWYNDQNTTYTNITPNPTKAISIGSTKNIPRFTYLSKQPSSRLTYLFAINKDNYTVNDVQIWAGGMSGTQTVTYLGNETSGSGRSTSSDATHTLTATDGKFNDSFDGQAVHIYKIEQAGDLPLITSWGNNKTINDTLAFDINVSEVVMFNATANQSITTWNWYKDGVEQGVNVSQINLSWDTTGTKTVSVNGTNSNGTSDTKTWTVTVNPVSPNPSKVGQGGSPCQSPYCDTAHVTEDLGVAGLMVPFLFFDSFDDNDHDWTVVTGNISMSGGKLRMTGDVGARLTKLIGNLTNAMMQAEINESNTDGIKDLGLRIDTSRATIYRSYWDSLRSNGSEAQITDRNDTQWVTLNSSLWARTPPETLYTAFKIYSSNQVVYGSKTSLTDALSQPPIMTSTDSLYGFGDTISIGSGFTVLNTSNVTTFDNVAVSETDASGNIRTDGYINISYDAGSGNQVPYFILNLTGEQNATVGYRETDTGSYTTINTYTAGENNISIPSTKYRYTQVQVQLNRNDTSYMGFQSIEFFTEASGGGGGGGSAPIGNYTVGSEGNLWDGNGTIDNVTINQGTKNIELLQLVSDYYIYYRFDESTGTLLSDDNTTTAYNGYYQGSGSFVGSQYHNAHVFNSGDSFDVADSKNLLTVGNITVMAMVKVEDDFSTDDHRIIYKKQDDNNGWQFNTLFTVGKGFVFGVKRDGTDHYTGTTAVNSNNTWYHVAGTFDNSSNVARLYVDSINRSDMSVGGITYAAGTNYSMWVGKRADNGRFFIGTLDELKIFRRVLTQAEIAQSANNSMYRNGNFTTWKDAGSGNTTEHVDVNVTTPANTNYSVYYRQNETGDFVQLASAQTGNTSHVLDTEYQDTEIVVQLNGNDTATPELMKVTFFMETASTDSIPPTPINVAAVTGNFWIKHTWQAGAGNITNSYNVSVNGTWHNGTTDSFWNNSDLLPHGWSNISVYAYNSSGSGTLSSAAASLNTQVPNNPISISGVADEYGITEGQWLNLTATASDADSDVPVFDDDTGKFQIGSGNGSVAWKTADGDQGAYIIIVNVTDNNGSVASKEFTLTVSDSTPGDVSAASITNNSYAGGTIGQLWILFSWPAAANADSYQIVMNDTHNRAAVTTSQYYSEEYPAHSTGINFSTRAYNATLDAYGAWANKTVDIPNTAPIVDITGITDINPDTGDMVSGYLWLNETEALGWTADISDIDGDTITNTTNATSIFGGTLTAGSYSGTTSKTSAGLYDIDVSSCDEFGLCATNATIITNITDVTQIRQFIIIN